MTRPPAPAPGRETEMPLAAELALPALPAAAAELEAALARGPVSLHPGDGLPGTPLAQLVLAGFASAARGGGPLRLWAPPGSAMAALFERLGLAPAARREGDWITGVAGLAPGPGAAPGPGGAA